MKARPIIERFWEKVNKNGVTMPHMTTCCWSWTGAVSVKGYGSIRLDKGKSVNASRVAWFLETGEFPLNALHHCDNPNCVRFSHLFEGTKADNNADCKNKGRQKPPVYVAGQPMARGEQHPHAKLTDEIVKIIRDSPESSGVLASQYGVCKSTVKRARNGRTWSHLAA